MLPDHHLDWTAFSKTKVHDFKYSCKLLLAGVEAHDMFVFI